MTGREKDDWALPYWKMYDVPVTFSILAPHPNAAMAYVEQKLPRLELGHDDSPAYSRDHAVIDGNVRLCDCVDHRKDCS